MEIAGSLLGADLLHLEDDVKQAERWGIHWLHFDQMDGHFVPNICFGPAFVSAVRSITHCFLDVHLMLSEPERYIESYVNAGADSITIHAEIAGDIGAILDEIHRRGCRTGLSLNPETPPEAVLPYIDKLDMILVMLVKPGFGGQSLREDCVQKLPVLKEIVAKSGREIHLEVDGGINVDNVPHVFEAGADVLVMGTGLYLADDPEEVVRILKEDYNAFLNHSRRLPAGS